MCTDAKQKIKDAYTRLVNLNVTALLGALYSRDVITSREKQIIHSITIESDKMAYLLDHVIIPSLEAGTTEKIKHLLEVMEGSDDPVIKSVGRRVGMLSVVVYLKINSKSGLAPWIIYRCLAQKFGSRNFSEFPHTKFWQGSQWIDP